MVRGSLVTRTKDWPRPSRRLVSWTSTPSAAESMKLVSDRSTMTLSAPTAPASWIPVRTRGAVYRSSSPDTETTASSRVRLATTARHSSRCTCATVGRGPQAAHTRCVSVCLHGLELVADPADGHQSFRPGRITLELAADVRDMQVARALVTDERAVPEVAHDLAPREHPLRLSGEQGEQFELGCGQRELFVADARLVLGEIELKVAHSELRDRPARIELAPAEQRPNPRHQLGYGERLAHVVVRADLQPENTVELAVFRRQHQDRHRAFISQSPADLDSGEPRQHQVEDEQIVRPRTGLLERSVAVVDRLDLEALGLQRVLDRLGDCRLVLDDQDSLRHQVMIFALGTATRTCVPAPSSDSSSIVPPIARVASSAIARPRPNPSVPLEARKKR